MRPPSLASRAISRSISQKARPAAAPSDRRRGRGWAGPRWNRRRCRSGRAGGDRSAGRRRWCAPGGCGQGVRPPSGRAGTAAAASFRPDPWLGAGAQAGDIGPVAIDDPHGDDRHRPGIRCKNSAMNGAAAKASNAAADDIRNSAAPTSQAAQAATPSGPGDAEQHAQPGRHAFAAAEQQPRRQRMAQHRGQPGHRAGSAPMPRQQHRNRALRRVQQKRRRRQIRRPVRSTLVAPILPDPIFLISPSPAAFVSSRPNGTEPSRKPRAVVRTAIVTEHAPPGLPCADDPALERAAVERGILRLAGQRTGLDLPDRLRLEQAQIRRRPHRQPPGVAAQQPGRGAPSAGPAPPSSAARHCAPAPASPPAASPARRHRPAPGRTGTACRPRRAAGGPRRWHPPCRLPAPRRRPAGPNPGAAAATASHRCGNRRSRSRFRSKYGGAVSQGDVQPFVLGLPDQRQRAGGRGHARNAPNRRSAAPG